MSRRNTWVDISTGMTLGGGAHTGDQPFQPAAIEDEARQAGIYPPDLSGFTNSGASYGANGLGVVWLQDLDFRGSAGTYYINGVLYSVPQTDFSLSAADATDDRIDVIAVDSNGQWVVVEGVPATPPAKPSVDVETQFEVTFVLVEATATTPTFNSNLDPIYQENTEWTTSVTSSVSAASTNFPFNGTKSIAFTNAASGQYVNFAKGSDVDLTQYNNLVLNIRSQAKWPASAGIVIQAYKGTATRGVSVALRDGTYGFNSALINTYQQVVIPLRDFNTATLPVDGIRLTWQGGRTAVTMNLDDIYLQGGLVTNTVNGDMSWLGTWSADTQYTTNQVVAYGGALYIALQPSTGATPDVSTSDWEVLVTGSVAGASPIGPHEIWVSAGSMTPSTTAGCAALATVEIASGQPDVTTLDFDSASTEHAQFSITMPKSWNEGTVTFQPVWSHAATTTNFGVCWKLAGVAVGNDDAMGAAFGTAQSSVDTGGTTNDLYKGPASSAITIAGTPAAGDTVFFRVSRVHDDAGDTMAIDARLHGVVITITTDAGTDA